MCFSLFSIPTLDSLFNLFGVWHALLPLPLMVQYIRGLEADIVLRP